MLESWVGRFATGASYQEAREKIELILGIHINIDSTEGIAERLGKVGASVLDSPPPIAPDTEGEIIVQIHAHDLANEKLRMQPPLRRA